MNLKRTFALFIFIIASGYFAYSQNSRELKRTFVDAEYRLLYNEYKEALPLFLQLYDAGITTPNIKYRIGQCYLQIPGEKEKAIPYLEEAVENISNNYNVGYFEQEKAPVEALYQLGVAYRITDRIEEALSYFKSYKTKIRPTNQEANKLVDAEIEACNNALALKKRPTNLLEQNLGKKINSSFSNTHAVVSGDETRIVFLSELQFYDAIFFSQKINGQWVTAKNVSLQFESSRPLKPVHLSYDGNTLYLCRDDNNDFNFYVSTFEKNKWTPVVPLSEKINSAAFEEHLCTTKDGNIIYFTSNRDGGFGGYDIYKSVKDENGEWQDPVNLGETINTPFDEAFPCITEDRKKLYFSSQGHLNMGGLDIFYSTFENGQWQKPVNMGFPINTTDDDQWFFPLKNGQIAYISKVKPNGYGKMDIYRLNLYEREYIPEMEKNLNANQPKN
jgi:hypothetical protein